MNAIVIGGGIAGCSTAYALAKRGIAVTLVERNADIALEASGNPVAMLYPKLSALESLANHLAQDGFHFTLNLLNQQANNNLFFKACGQLQLAFNAAEIIKQNALFNADFLSKNQLQMQFINASDASELVGIHLKTGGLFLPQAGWVKPVEFCKILSTHPLIRIITDCQALSIKNVDHQWHIHHKNGDLTAENVVICNANDIKQFNYCQTAAITPVRGQLNFFAENAASRSIKTIVCTDHYLSPAIDGMHAIGTSYAPNNMQAELSAADTHSNLAALRNISPEIRREVNLNSVTGRVAWRSQTLDYRPLAGQLIDEQLLRKSPPRYNANVKDLPWLNGLYVNAGHGSKGMITAPICGELIANLICKTALPLDNAVVSSLNPSRFLLREFGLKQLAARLYK